MGRIIKNHWARLVVLIAAAIQIGGAIEGFFWPKVTWDFSTTSLNCLVKPFPIVQTLNLVLGVIIIAWEWPLVILADTIFHRSIHARLVVFAISAASSMFLYQAHSSTIYYLLGLYGYALALAEREIIYPEPWTILPVDEMPAIIRTHIDSEQGLGQSFSQNPEYGAAKYLEDDSVDDPIDAIECSSEESIHDSVFSSKEPKRNSARSSQCSPTLTLAPINQSPITWPSIKFQSPTVQEVGSLFVLSRKDSSRPYNRMRAKTWHNGVD